jgi:hypothetical protein
MNVSLGHTGRPMFSFSKSLRHHQQVRRFSIAVTTSGWEVREERDAQVVRSVHYQDWHRVERARKAIALELADLQRQGWSEVAN